MVNGVVPLPQPTSAAQPPDPIRPSALTMDKHLHYGIAAPVQPTLPTLPAQRTEPTHPSALTIDKARLAQSTGLRLPTPVSPLTLINNAPLTPSSNMDTPVARDMTLDYFKSLRTLATSSPARETSQPSSSLNLGSHNNPTSAPIDISSEYFKGFSTVATASPTVKALIHSPSLSLGHDDNLSSVASGAVTPPPMHLTSDHSRGPSSFPLHLRQPHPQHSTLIPQTIRN